MRFLLLVFISSTILYAQPEVPQLKTWATDLTGTLSSGQLEDLNHRLKTFEDSTSNQAVLLMISSLNNYPIEYYAYDVGTKNKVGSKKFDNGIVILIAKDDRQVRIEVGYGLEGALPDALASSIVRNVMIPHFRKNDYYTGINEGINAVISAVKGEYTAEPKKVSDKGRKSSGVWTIFMIIFFIISFFLRGGRGRRGRGGGFIFFPGGSWGGGSSGGGGFGGMGGFSGGGGSFGGGGASGSW